MTRQYLKLTIILVITLFFIHCNGMKEIELVKNNKSDYIIVIPQNADKNCHRASKIFQEYFYKITNDKLSIITDDQSVTNHEICIGETNRSNQIKSNELHSDGFIIRTDDSKLFIIGGNDRGIIYGVTGFLEKYLGCRKFSPDEEYIPQLSNITLNPINEIENPKINFRCVNGRFNRDQSYNEWRRIDKIADMFANGYYVHTFERLMPWEDYFDKHREYYAVVGGKRIRQQLCMTHPDVINIVIEKLKKEIALQPEKEVWSVSQNDNALYCSCPDCQKIIDEDGTPAGPVIYFVNQIAAAFPDKIISTLAYRFSRRAPKIRKPLENVQVMLCTIECNRRLPIEINPGEQSQMFKEDIINWNKISDRIYLWDYTVNFHHHVSPFPNLQVLQPNIQFFLANDAFDMFQQTNTSKGHEFSELKSYMISALLWNPEVDIDSVKSDFIVKYYGAASPWIKKYIDHLESELKRTGQGLDIYGHPAGLGDGILSIRNCNSYINYFDNAESVTSDDPISQNRVQITRLPLQYALMEIGKNDMFGQRGWYKKENNDYTLKQEMADRFNKFIEVCKRNKIPSLDERGLTPEKYEKSTNHFIDIKVDGNNAFQKQVFANPLPAKKYSNGDPSKLTNGVQGASDYKVHWIGWEALDFEITIDLESIETHDKIIINSLYDQNSWILHPEQISCSLSKNNQDYWNIGIEKVEGNQRNEDRIRSYHFTPGNKTFRYIKFKVDGTIYLPDWHHSAGGDSWVFIDEIIVE